MRPLELIGADSGIVGAQSFDCLFLFVVVEKPCAFDAIVKLPINEWGSDYGDGAKQDKDTRCELAFFLVGFFARRKDDRRGEVLHLP